MAPVLGQAQARIQIAASLVINTKIGGGIEETLHQLQELALALHLLSQEVRAYLLQERGSLGASAESVLTLEEQVTRLGDALSTLICSARISEVSLYSDTISSVASSARALCMALLELICDPR